MQTLTAQDVKHLWDRGEDFLLVNTLPAAEFARTKIPGSVNLPEDDEYFVAHLLDRAASKEKQIVLYCASRTCESSNRAARKLLDAGFEDVWIFEDGAEGWREFNAKRGNARRPLVGMRFPIGRNAVAERLLYSSRVRVASVSTTAAARALAFSASKFHSASSRASTRSHGPGSISPEAAGDAATSCS